LLALTITIVAGIFVRQESILKTLPNNPSKVFARATPS